MRIFRNVTLLLFILIFSVNHANAQLIEDSRRLTNIQDMLAKQKLLAKGRSSQLFDVLSLPLSADENQALQFIYAYMPLSDLADYDGNFFLSQVKAVLKARKEMPWGTTVPEDVFLHFVLPPRVNNENLDAFRVLMYDELKQRVAGLSLHDAILEVNHWCHEKVTYRGSDERTSSPLASLKTSFGRCGEESTFTVTALRTIGIPARQVYTPRWAHTDDNHAWVEVWLNGKWYFLGACEPDSELNMGWFAEPARRAMLVHTRAYGQYFGDEPIIDKQEKFAELNLIENYASTGKLIVKITDSKGNPVESANVEYQLYNYAEFYPIAKAITDKNGISFFLSGLGDIIVYAYKDHSWGYQKVTIGSADTLTIQIQPKPNLTKQNLDIIPPVEKTPLPSKVTAEQITINAHRLLFEDSIRSQYMATFRDSSWVAQFASRLKLDEKRLLPIFNKSYGNWKEIADFLTVTPIYRQDWAIKLLENVSEKDLRDTKAEILTDHLMNSFGFNNSLSTSDPDFFAQYVLNGRIANEMMLPWRKYLQEQFAYDFIMNFKSDPTILVDWIIQNIVLDEKSNIHSRAPLSPRGVFELKMADKRSRDIFFVAVCRSLGQAARVNTETGIPQYFSHGEWINVAFEPADDLANKKAILSFVLKNEGFDPKYAINFTIARQDKGVFRTVDFEYGKPLSTFENNIEVLAGHYMLITGNRQSDGSVLSVVNFFEAPAAGHAIAELEIRENLNPVDPWGVLPSATVNLLKFPERDMISLKDISKEKISIFIWIEPDKEPSKHVLADLPAVSNVLENSQVNLIFLLTETRFSKAFNPKSFVGLPKNHQFLIDKNENLLKSISTQNKKAMLRNFPIIVIADKKGNLVYYSDGYKIGVGEQIAKEILKFH